MLSPDGTRRHLLSPNDGTGVARVHELGRGGDAMTGPLTDRQQQALHALEQAIAANGYAPTVREFATVLGVTTNAATALLVALEHKGAIRRWPGKARAISIVGAEELGAEARARAAQENADDARIDAAREENHDR